MNVRAEPVQHLLFEPRAADLLGLLRDLQHIDSTALESITTELVARRRPDTQVSYDELRARLAVWLFEHEHDMRPEQADLLRAEWARLFS